jgi:hypothetical protein
MCPSRAPSAALLTAIVAAAFPGKAQSQLVTQPAPFSVQFDASSLLAGKPQSSLPLWIEGVSLHHYADESTRLHRTTLRLRLRHLPNVASFVEIRVGLLPGAEKPAFVTAWNETGQQKFRSEPFGSATATITEVMRIPNEGIDYIEVDLPSDGSRLTSLFATVLRKGSVYHSIDFPPNPTADAFSGGVRSTPLPEHDRVLWNRVAAVLDPGPFDLFSDQPQSLEFTLSKAPDLALLSFEVRNISPEDPIALTANGLQLPPVALTLPDLTDPGWKETPATAGGVARVTFSGWIRVQQILPRGVLVKGENVVWFHHRNPSQSAQVRRVEIQLKN